MGRASSTSWRKRSRRRGIPPGKLCFEITETAAIDNLPQSRKLLQRLSARGIRFALDDFGTGMASSSGPRRSSD